MPGESRSHFILTSQNWPKTGDPATYLDIPFGRPGPSKLVVWSCTQELRPSLKTSMAEVAATLLDESSEEDAAAAVPAAVVTPLPRKRRNRGCLDATPHKTPRLSPRLKELKAKQLLAADREAPCPVPAPVPPARRAAANPPVLALSGVQLPVGELRRAMEAVKAQGGEVTKAWSPQ
ncbi:unnamed protein product, partial [Durusdinium trenchii]